MKKHNCQEWREEGAGCLKCSYIDTFIQCPECADSFHKSNPCVHQDTDRQKLELWSDIIHCLSNVDYWINCKNYKAVIETAKYVLSKAAEIEKETK